MASNPTPTILGSALTEMEQEAAAAPNVTANQAQVGLVANQTDGVGVVGQGDEPLGHGFDVEEQGSWTTRTGWRVGAWLRWRK